MGYRGSMIGSSTLLYPFLLYHLLSTRTLSFWTIFFDVLSPILRWKRRVSFAPTVKALLGACETSRVCAQKALASAGVCQTLVVLERSHLEMKGEEMLWR